jgi:hypothetical protein
MAPRMLPVSCANAALAANIPRTTSASRLMIRIFQNPPAAPPGPLVLTEPAQAGEFATDWADQYFVDSRWIQQTCQEYLKRCLTVYDSVLQFADVIPIRGLGSESPAPSLGF